uniref:Down syndrome cell adhesion molecule-like protein Dscam2 n=2 Tax=Scylla olivacea TaxID=85551 RepID=A0A0P4WN52_SCYOL
MQIRATCLVQEGDQPVRYAWTKDARPLDARLGVRTSQLDAFTSILVIERAAAEHSGNYTCTASNAAAASATTARLTVNVPPTWVVEPSSTSVALGGSLALHCLARGFPDPVVTWRRQAASGEFVGVVEGTGSGESSIVQWKNGTLWIGRSARGHEGRYLCEAGNGVPPGLSKLVDITVNEPPWFRATEQRQEVRVGGTATLTCHAHGDAPLTLTWSKDAVPLSPLPRYQVSQHEEQDQGGTISKLVVTDAHLEDSGTFSCTASNTHGVRTSQLHLLVQDVPGHPSGIEVVEVGPQHLVLTWTSPQDSNAPITAYIITLEPQSPSAGAGAAREERVGGQERRLVLKDLTPATRYSLRVAAENRVGRGRSSPPVLGSTEEQPPSAPPRDVRVMAVSSSALRVSWEPPPHNSTHGTLLGYHLGYKLASDAEGAYNFTRVGGVGSIGVTSARVSGLSPHSHYSVVLRAFNSKGTGPTSPPATAITLEDKPSAPPGQVRCDGVSSSSLVVTWMPPPPSERNGVVTSYRVAFWKTAATEDSSEEAAMMSKDLRAQLDNLRPWMNYSVTVAASTRAGQGVASTPLICTTHQDVPEALTMVKAVASGPRAAVVSWAPPTHPHGRLTRYTVYWKAMGTGTGGEISRRVDPQLTHVTLHDLSHVAHKVWVTAATRKGEGPPSSVVMVKPSHSVAAGVWSVGGNVTAAWREDVSLPCGAVGMPEPTLVWTHDGVPVHTNKDRAVVQRDGTLSLSDLQRDDGGLYTCTATNRHGHDSALYHLNVLVPPSPPSLHVIETTTSSVRVQWNVEDTGGATIQGSSLHYRVAGDQWTQVAVTGDQRTYTTHNLQCGSLHHFYVTVHNHVGRSEPSKTESARTKGRPPQSPPKFQFVTTNSSQATLYLSQWIDGGCPITHFSVEYRKESVTTWTTVGTEIPPTRTYSLGGLEPGNRYMLRVTAHNTAGFAPAEYSITTPSLGHSVAADSGVSVWGGAPSTSSAWQELRVVVPAAVSTLTLLLTLTTVFVCLRKRSPARTHQKGSPETVIGTTEKIGPQEELYTTVRRPAPSPPQQQQQQPQQQQQQESREAQGDYPRDELYHYAAATYRVGNGTPPPPAPPSPPTHAHRPLSRGQKAFTALVYQAPSLHDVDCPNLAEGEGRVPWPRASPPHGPAGVADSQSEGYGSLMSPRGPSPPAPGAPHHRHPAKHPRGPRTCVRNVRFP